MYFNHRIFNIAEIYKRLDQTTPERFGAEIKRAILDHETDFRRQLAFWREGYVERHEKDERFIQYHSERFNDVYPVVLLNFFIYNTQALAKMRRDQWHYWLCEDLKNMQPAKYLPYAEAAIKAAGDAVDELPRIHREWKAGTINHEALNILADNFYMTFLTTGRLEVPDGAGISELYPVMEHFGFVNRKEIWNKLRQHAQDFLQEDLPERAREIFVAMVERIKPPEANRPASPETGVGKTGPQPPVRSGLFSGLFRLWRRQP